MQLSEWLKAKPHEALQSLLVTSRHQPCFGFAARTSCNKPHSAGHSLGTKADVYHTRSIKKAVIFIKMVTCMMVDSSSDRENELFLLIDVVLSLKSVYQGKQMNRKHSNQKVHHLYLLLVNLFYPCTDWSKACFPSPELECVLNSAMYP